MNLVTRLAADLSAGLRSTTTTRYSIVYYYYYYHRDYYWSVTRRNYSMVLPPRITPQLFSRLSAAASSGPLEQLPLDVRDHLRQTLNVTALRILDPSKIKTLRDALSPWLLKVPRTRSVVEDEEENKEKDAAATAEAEEPLPDNPKKKRAKLSPNKLLLLDETISKADIPQPIDKLVKENQVQVTNYTVRFDYEYWTAEQSLSAILPEGIVVPSSFETIGHIGHMNLRDEHHPYRFIIGRVVLDKSPALQTVVNKTDKIDDEYRFFKMEVLAGKNNLIAEVKENNCVFRFDFSKVYWNSKLHNLHNKVVQEFSPNEVVCDMFGGVGPFAIPAAKKKCIVHSNDLNPMSYQALLGNIQLNKVTDFVKAYNMDARDFMRHIIAISLPTPKVDHVVMNLPALSIEFLDVFRGLYSKVDILATINIPKIHCMCFSSELDTYEIDIIKRATTALGAPIKNYKIHYVRSVAPNKDMFYLCFKLPRDIAFQNSSQADTTNNTPVEKSTETSSNLKSES